MSAVAVGRSVGLDELTAFEMKLALRGRSPLVGAFAYGVAMAVVALIGLASFRQMGLGALTPASTGLLEVGLLVPTLIALIGGGASLHGDRDEALRSMLRAAGLPARSILLAKLLAVLALSSVVVLTGTAAAALVLTGVARPADVATLVFLLVLTMLASAAAASIGLLVSALARDRAQALVGSVAVWSVLAIGVDLLVLGLAPALRAGGPLLALAAVVDPIESARIAGLLALGADSHVLGSLGAHLAATIGAGGAILALLAALVLWTIAPFAAACVVLARREDG